MAPETNVRVPQSALDAVQRIAIRRRRSRDDTVRWLLDQHLEAQEALEADDRLTHISTVIRYPPPRIGRGQPRPGVPLRLRLRAGVSERLRAVSLKLPGQHARGRHEYQAPLLTDAVMTAIVRQEAIDDPELDGLMPLIRHRAAIGLWRLVVAAFSTRSERLVYDLAHLAEQDRHGTTRPAGWMEQVAEQLREGDVAWHGPYRGRATDFLARRLLPSGAEAAEILLYEQDSERWRSLLSHMYRRGLRNDPFKGFSSPHHTLEGRGGAAVWRAERKVAQFDMLRWLRETANPATERQWNVRRPGWTLTLPDGWRPLLLDAREEMPQLWRACVEERRVLSFDIGRFTMLWPTIDGHNGAAGPVPRIDVVLATRPNLTGADMVEAVLLRLGPNPAMGGYPGEADPAQDVLGDDAIGFCRNESDGIDVGEIDLWDIDLGLLGFEDLDEVEADEETSDMPFADEPGILGIPMSAHRAHSLGFIDLAERDHLIEQAQLSTQNRMRHIIANTRHASPAKAVAMELQIDNPYRFAELARSAGTALTIAVSEWTWQGDSIATAVQDDTVGPDALAYLTDQLFWRSRRLLEHSMEQAAKAAFSRYGQPSL